MMKNWYFICVTLLFGTIHSMQEPFSPYCLDQDVGFYSPVAQSILDTRISDQTTKDALNLLSKLDSPIAFLNKGARELFLEGVVALNKTHKQKINNGDLLIDKWLIKQKVDVKNKIEIAKKIIVEAQTLKLTDKQIEEIEQTKYDEICLQIDKFNINLALGINYLIRNNINI